MTKPVPMPYRRQLSLAERRANRAWVRAWLRRYWFHRVEGG